ncbi:hypothetical protein CRM22_000392 [Opisthorchis felineus]|uniref:Uncharacterized protein n=1 Tax=Opisthorchis felineus TaxID=147828 RepID=A0A4S2MLL4_OPIFE|nr:hypothetical protein CRM22_000392 [Opisthorchis felineus]
MTSSDLHVSFVDLSKPLVHFSVDPLRLILITCIQHEFLDAVTIFTRWFLPRQELFSLCILSELLLSFVCVYVVFTKNGFSVHLVIFTDGLPHQLSFIFGFAVYIHSASHHIS